MGKPQWLTSIALWRLITMFVFLIPFACGGASTGSAGCRRSWPWSISCISARLLNRLISAPWQAMVAPELGRGAGQWIGDPRLYARLPFAKAAWNLLLAGVILVVVYFALSWLVGIASCVIRRVACFGRPVVFSIARIRSLCLAVRAHKRTLEGDCSMPGLAVILGQPGQNGLGDAVGRMLAAVTFAGRATSCVVIPELGIAAGCTGPASTGAEGMAPGDPKIGRAAGGRDRGPG